MTPERYKRACELFRLAREQAASHRAEFLNRACPSDEELRELVWDMIQHQDDPLAWNVEVPETILSTLAERLGPAPQRLTPDQDPELQSGSKIANFELVRPIGEGGFGVVWLASQTDPVRRQVALKIAKKRSISPDFTARIREEGQILALMTHPGIATIFDVGTTATGRPYLAMELVGGQPVTEYCENHRLAIPERLRLFIRICHAISHAHQKSVFHRDIKPSNLLVTTIDGIPVPKVIDFGIAGVASGGKTLTDQLHVAAGTPIYMPPEWRATLSSPHDARGEIFSLGVVLAEIVLGSAGVVASNQETEEDVRSRTPTPQPGAGISADLQAIVTKCTAATPLDRYSTVDELIDDLQCFLEHRPVAARSSSHLYRTQKLVRRNRQLVAGALLLLSGIVGTTIGLLKAMQSNEKLRTALQDLQEQRDIANSQAKLADAAARQARQQADISAAVSEFVSRDLLSVVTPSSDKSRGGVAPLRGAVEQMSDRLDEAARPGGVFSNQPLLEAKLRLALAASLCELRRYGTAERSFRRAIEIRELHLGRYARATLEAQEALAGMYGASGDLEAQVELRRRLVESWEVVAGPESCETLAAVGHLAETYSLTERIEEALSEQQRAFQLSKKVFGDEAPITLRSMCKLSFVLERGGRHEEALKLRRQLLIARRRVLGPDSITTIDSQKFVAMSQRKLGHLENAIETGKEVVDAMIRAHGERRPATIYALRDLAESFRRAERFEEAEAAHRRTVEIHAAWLGDDHPDTLNSRAYHAASLLDLGRPREWIHELEKVWRAYERTVGTDHQLMQRMRSLLREGLEHLTGRDVLRTPSVLDEARRVYANLAPDDAAIREAIARAEQRLASSTASAAVSTPLGTRGPQTHD